MAHKSKFDLQQEAETLKVCEEICRLGRKLTDEGHVIVITTAEDKSDLHVAQEIAAAMPLQQEAAFQKELRKPRECSCSGSKRFTVL